MFRIMKHGQPHGIGRQAMAQNNHSQKPKKTLLFCFSTELHYLCIRQSTSVTLLKQHIMNTYKIQTNASGTRSMTISENHLDTIKKYALLKNLIDSNGIVDETVLDKLKLNVRSMLESCPETDKELLDLCLDVIYNNNMKAFGLNQLITLYTKWEKESSSSTEE